MNDIQKLFNSFEGESGTYREIRKEEKQDAARHTWSLLEGVGRLSRDRTGKRAASSSGRSAASAKTPSLVQGASTSRLDETWSGENRRTAGDPSMNRPAETASLPLNKKAVASPASTLAGGQSDNSLAAVFKRLQKTMPSSELSLRSTFQKLIR